ncbi:MAG: phosphate ABC transporter substrate-binding protein [Desulfuromonadales bacterium]|nr:phosphate ABC transporter substrate-binding protein [Desulfuromonadales bacterium]
MALLPRVFLVIAFACGLPLLPAAHASDVETYRYAGATTLQRDFMVEAVQKFAATHNVRFELEGGNSTAGIKALCAGGIDLAGSGRFLTNKEKAAGLVEYLVGWDPLVLVVHSSNPLENVSSEDLRRMLLGTVFNWNQLGGRDLPLVQVAAPPGSGVHDAVEQFLMKEGQHISSQAVISLVVADADKNVSLLPAGFTLTSRSMVDASQIKIVKVDGLLPERGAVTSGQYPLIKPLLLVTKGKPRGTLALFVNFAKSPEGQALIAKKFVPLADK